VGTVVRGLPAAPAWMFLGLSVTAARAADARACARCAANLRIAVSVVQCKRDNVLIEICDNHAYLCRANWSRGWINRLACLQIARSEKIIRVSLHLSLANGIRYFLCAIFPELALAFYITFAIYRSNCVFIKSLISNNSICDVYVHLRARGWNAQSRSCNQTRL